MSRALYRTYRSKSLDEVVGQGHITNILAKAVAAGRISHAYLLTGPRGVGKTSVARILAHAINKLDYTDDATHLDIIEIDAASNNGVEDVRDLRDKVQIAPVSAPKKVYIIDEVHMLSKAAFNALLKTLEEPPEHVVFILATTDVDKLPATIISRTQRYSFRAISQADAVAHLAKIAKAEKIKIDDAALNIIAQRGDGSFRDSISLLDQLASLSDGKDGITEALVTETLGLAPISLIDDLLHAIESHDIAALVPLLDQANDAGIPSVTIADQLTKHLAGKIAEKPQLLPLLDQLLDVARSSQPDLKLLAVLGAVAAKQPSKTAALATPVLEISATIEELSAQATKVKPSLAKKPSSPAATEDNDPKATAAPDFTSLKRENLGAKGGSLSSIAAGDQALDWPALIEYTKKQHVALYSVLSKCSPELEDGTLKLYTLNNFYKKKLDDPRYSAMLHQSLAATHSFQPTIHTIPTALPPKDSQAAAIAAMMGGGEEVFIEAT